jgi:transposase-like protein
MPGELPDKVQRWTAKRRATVVLMILKGETSSQEVARKYRLRVAEVEEWRDRFLMGAENELRSQAARDPRERHKTRRYSLVLLFS